jgi:hypothetical protein
MDTTSITLGISNIFLAVTLIVISIPLIKRKVSMNKVYGVRIKKAFESEENWYKINAYGGKQLILWSLPLVLLGIATFFLPLEENGPMIIFVACAPGIIIIPAIVAIFRYAKKL